MGTKYEKAELFEEKLRHIYRIALGAAVLHKATAWLGAGTLTWATVVLMGGFASQILISDFKWITVLVVLIVALLALSHFSIKLITRKNLFIGSINPVHFTYRDQRRLVVTIIDLASLIFQFLLIFFCLRKGIPNIYRSDFKSVHFYSFLFNTAPAASTDPAAPLQHCLQQCFSDATYSSAATMAATCGTVCLDSTSNNNLQICLYSFFLLLNSTSICAAVCLVYGWIVKPLVWGWLVGARECLSLRRYHDEVLSRAMNLGLAEADDFDSRVFLLRALGEDLMMRNIGPLEVRRQNLEVIEYLYNHPQGSEMVYQGLASEDTLLQQAAANIVGFWAKSDLRLDRQLELLCRMGDKLGLPGKAAEGAANSFSALAKQWTLGISLIEPSPLLRVCVSQSRAAAGRGGGAAIRGAGGRGAAPPADDSTAGGGAADVAEIVPSDDAAAGGRAAGGGAAVAAYDAAAAAGGGAADVAEIVPSDDAAAGGRAAGGGGGAADVAEIVPSDDAAAGGRAAGGGAAVAAYDAAAAGGGATGGGAAAPTHGYNVVDKVIDLILQNLAPTLLIYVRVLDSFFMSASVREHVSKTGDKRKLEEKLKGIINSNSDKMQPRTRLIAFYVLCRLRSSDGTQIEEEDKKSMEELLNSVDTKFTDHLHKEPAGKKIIWVEESDRYKDICEQLGNKRHGVWLGLARINGKDLVAPGPDVVRNCSGNGGVVNKSSV